MRNKLGKIFLIYTTGKTLSLIQIDILPCVSKERETKVTAETYRKARVGKSQRS